MVVVEVVDVLVDVEVDVDVDVEVVVVVDVEQGVMLIICPFASVS